MVPAVLGEGQHLLKVHVQPRGKGVVPSCGSGHCFAEGTCVLWAASASGWPSFLWRGRRGALFQVQDAAPAVISTGSVLHGLIRGQLMLLFLQRLGLCLNFCLWEPVPQVQVLDQAMDLYYR